MKTKTKVPENQSFPFIRHYFAEYENHTAYAPSDIYAPAIISRAKVETFKQTTEQKSAAYSERRNFSERMRTLHGTNWKQILRKQNL